MMKPSGSGRVGKRKDDEYGNGDCLRWSVFAFNMFFLFWSLVIIGIGIWMVAGRSVRMSEILGNPLYYVVTAVVFIVGIAILIVSILGCCGAWREIRCMMVVYFVILLIVLLFLLISVILAGIFRAGLEDTFKRTMEQTLKERYRFDIERLPQNEAITDGWDLMQKHLNCCAVENYGWTLYQESRWFERQGIQGQNRRVFEKEFVPASCCVTDWETWAPLDQAKCQNLVSTSPNVPLGPINFYVYWKGCFHEGKAYLGRHAFAIIGVGIIAFIVLIIGMVLSFCLCRHFER